MLPRQRKAHVRVETSLWIEGAACVVCADHAAQVIALLVVDGAKRLVDVVVVERELERAETRRAGRDVLGTGKRVEPAVEFEVGGEIEASRRIVDQRLRIAGEQRIAATAVV